MRVTWVALEWPRVGEHSGGVGRYVKRLAAQMRSRVDLTVVACHGAEPLEGVNLVKIPIARGRFSRYYQGAWLSRAVVASMSPDVVHAHGDDFFLSKATPIVRSFYGSSWEEARSSRGLRRLNHLVLAGAEKVAQHRARMRLGIAPESFERFNCEYTFPPYLRDADAIYQRRPSQDPLVVFIGSHEGRKQGFLAEQAVRKLRDSGQRVRLVVIGPEADRASWDTWVEHRSHQSDAEVSALLDEAWVLASPSQYEGFGIPLVEGLHHHLTVVSLPNAGSQFLKAQASEDLPLIVTPEQDFAQQLSDALIRGPLLTGAQLAAADRLVDVMSDLGSPARLLDIYQETVDATSAKNSA